MALHWLKGLLRNAAGDAETALASFDKELAQEPRGHLYGREIAANAWYAKGLVHAGGVASAVPIVSAALAAAPSGNGGWLLAVEPLLGVRHALDAWAPALALLHLRAR